MFIPFNWVGLVIGWCFIFLLEIVEVVEGIGIKIGMFVKRLFALLRVNMFFLVGGFLKEEIVVLGVPAVLWRKLFVYVFVSEYDL